MWPGDFIVNSFGSSQAGGAAQADLSGEFFVYGLIVLVALIGGIVLLAKSSGGKDGGSPATAVSKTAPTFSPWFPVR
jgi:hypothetical protein